MKIFMSCDIEGTNGIANWNETESDKREFPYFAQKMTDEVNSICKGINETSKDAFIFVKDAHDTGRTIDHKQLPENVALNRGWASSPLSMMFGIDKSFDATIMSGYHSASSQNGNPLSHTMSSNIIYIKINDLIASEFLMNYYTSLYFSVPVVMVSGDKMLCDFVRNVDENVLIVQSLTGVGDSTTSPHPNISLRALKETAAKSLSQIGKTKMSLPKSFKTEICYKNHQTVTRGVNYPGAYQVSGNTIGFDTDDYMNFLKYFMFINK